MKISYLGSGNAFAPQRYWGCIMVNEHIILDAAPTMLLNLKRLNADPRKISHIFISHYHADHYFGLPFLLLEYTFMSQTDVPLTIVGPPGVEEAVRQIFTIAFPDVARRGMPRPMHFIDVQPGERMTVDGITFTPVEMTHGSGVIRAFGYRLFLDEGLLAFSGDTCMTDELFTLAKGADILIVEACSKEACPIHLGLDDLRTLLKQVPEETIVLLNHLDTPGTEAWDDLPVIVPSDLETFEFSFPRKPASEVSHA